MGKKSLLSASLMAMMASLSSAKYFESPILINSTANQTMYISYNGDCSSPDVQALPWTDTPTNHMWHFELVGNGTDLFTIRTPSIQDSACPDLYMAAPASVYDNVIDLTAENDTALHLWVVKQAEGAPAHFTIQTQATRQLSGNTISINRNFVELREFHARVPYQQWLVQKPTFIT